MGIRIPSGSSNPISLADIWQNIYEKSGEEYPTPSAFPASNLQTLSRNIASSSTFLRGAEVTQSIGDERHWIAGTSSSIQSAGNVAGTGHYYAMDELWGANYPTITIQNITFERGGATETAFVDGETIQVEYNSDQSTAHTIGLYKDSNNTLVGSTFSNTTNAAGTGSWTNFDGSSLTGLEGAGSSGEDYYYKFTINNFNNKLSQRFTHWDTVNVSSISKDPSTTQYITDSSGTTAIAFSHGMTTGVAEVRDWTFTNATDGSNSKQNGSSAATVTSTSATPTITYTGTGTFGVGLTVGGNPTTARNEDTVGASSSVTINLSQAIPIVGFVNYTNVNQGATRQPYALSRGFSGNLIVGYDDNVTTSDVTPIDSSTVAVNTVKTQETVIETLTMNTPGTFNAKSLHQGDSASVIATATLTVAPTFTYSTTGNKTINVNTSQVFKVLSDPAPVGNNIAITVAQSDFSLSTTTYSTGITIPNNITANGVYTVTYDASADYSQNGASFDQTDTLTINPTTSIASSAASGYTTEDTNGNALTTDTHGVAPTTFTYTPTNVGSNIEAVAWAMENDFDFTSGNTATNGAVAGTFDIGGTKDVAFTVYETAPANGTSGADIYQQTVIEPTKSFDGYIVLQTTDRILRRGSSYQVNFQCDYVKNFRLDRDVSGQPTYQALTGTTATGIGNDFVNEAVTPTVTISTSCNVDNVFRSLRIVDTNYVSNTSTSVRNTGNDTTFKMYDGIPTAPTITAVGNGNDSATVTWTNGNYNNTFTVYVHTDAGGSTSPIATLYNQTSVSTYTDTGITAIKSVYFKVRAHNAGNTETADSGMSSVAYMYPGIVIAADPSTANITITDSQTQTYNFASVQGYQFSGAITSSPDIGSITSVTNTTASVSMDPDGANGIYTIAWNATATDSQTATEITKTLTVNPVAAVTFSGTELQISPPAGSGLSADTLTMEDNSSGDTITGWLWSITKDGSTFGTFNQTYTTQDVTISAVTLTSWGEGTYNVQFQVTGNSTTSAVRSYGTHNPSGTSNDYAFRIDEYADQTLAITGTFNTAGDLRRGSTYTVAATIGGSPIEAVNLLYQYRNSNPEPQWAQAVAVANDIFGTSEIGALTYNYTINSSQARTNTNTPDKFRIVLKDANDNSPLDEGAAMEILDGLPVTPTSISVSRGSGTSSDVLTVTWTGGDFSLGGYKVKIYDADNNDALLNTVNSAVTTYAYTNTTADTVARKFTVAGVNLEGEVSAYSSWSGAPAVAYPELDGRNTISDTSITLYADESNNTGDTNISQSFSEPLNQVDNETGLTYALTGTTYGLTLSNATPANNDATQATVTTGTSVGTGNVQLTVTSTDSQSTTSDCTVNIDYFPVIIAFSMSQTTNLNPSTDINPVVMWQGFAIGGDDISDPHWVLQFRNSADTADVGSSTTFVEDEQGGTDTQNSITNGGSTTGDFEIAAPSSGGSYILKVYNSANTALYKNQAITVVTANPQNLYHRYFEGNVFAHNNACDSAEDTRSASAAYRTTVYHSGTLATGTDFKTSNTLSTAWTPHDPIDGSGHWFSANTTHIVDVDNSPAGDVLAYLSSTPADLSIAYVSKTSTTITVRVTGDFRVTRNLEITTTYDYPNENWTPHDFSVASRVQAGSQDCTITGLSASTLYYVRVRGENNRPLAGNYTTYNGLQITTSATPASAILKRNTGSSWVSDAFQLYAQSNSGGYWTGGRWYNSAGTWRAEITNISGTTTVSGNNSNFKIGISSGVPTYAEDYFTGNSSGTISSSHSTIYIKAYMNIPNNDVDFETLVVTVTPAGSGVTTDSASIKFSWSTSGGGPPECFIAGTKITMADYSIKNIEDVIVGDEILSYDPGRTREITTSKVENIPSPMHNDLVEIDFGNFKNTNTHDHPYWIESKGLCSWAPDKTKARYNLECNQLQLDDRCLLLNGTNIEECSIVGIRDLTVQPEYTGESVQTYNLDVEDVDYYFANGILVHNKG